MDLNEHENDPYAPDPRASQRVAAQKRARQPDAAPEATNPRKLPLAPVAMIASAALLIGVLSYGLGRTPAQPLQLPPTSAQSFQTAPTAAPTPAATAEIAMIDAYAAPGRLLLGQIETTRQINPVAHYGAGWIHADVEGSGLVWLRAADVPDLALAGPDLAPAAVQPPTGRGLGVDTSNDWTQPDATPVPPTEPVATPAPEWPTAAPAVVTDFAKPDIKDRCQFVGCLGQQAVDLARANTCHALFWQYGSTDPETIPEPDLSAVRGCIWEGLYR